MSRLEEEGREPKHGPFFELWNHGEGVGLSLLSHLWRSLGAKKNHFITAL
jgi:hypothetical protein